MKVIRLDLLERNLPDAQEWIRRHFTAVPGRKEYNFRPRPGADSDCIYSCSHRSGMTLCQAFEHLVEALGGIERVLPNDLRHEVTTCASAKVSVVDAAVYLKMVYVVTSRGRKLVLTRREDQRTLSVSPDRLRDLTEFPDVALLGSIHGIVLGQRLFDQIFVAVPRIRQWSRY